MQRLDDGIRRDVIQIPCRRRNHPVTELLGDDPDINALGPQFGGMEMNPPSTSTSTSCRLRLVRNFRARLLNSSAFYTASDQVFDERARLRILHCVLNSLANLPAITVESHEVRILAQIVIQFIEGNFRLDLTFVQAAYGSCPEFSLAVSLNDDGVLDHGDALSGPSRGP